MWLLSRAFLVAAALALGACSAPSLVRPFRMDIQQGNYVSQEMVSQLKPGMSKAQVRFVMGTPLVTDIFHPDRWYYVFYNQPGYGKGEERRITVVFDKQGRLLRVEGDVVAGKPAGGGTEAEAGAAKANARGAQGK